MSIVKTKSGTEIDTDGVFTVQVYTTKGHFTVLAGSEKEARLLGDLLYKNDMVYKLYMISPKGKKTVLFL